MAEQSSERAEFCAEFVDIGRCGHSDAEHDAIADGRTPESAQVCPFCTSDPEALADAHEEGWRAGREHERQVSAVRMAQAWDEGYAARRSEDASSPGESNPYRLSIPVRSSE